MLLGEIKQYLTNQFGEVNFKPLTGGYTNGVFYIEGTNPPLVAKISNRQSNDGLNEIEALNLLTNDESVPKVHEVCEVGSHRIILLDYLPGRNAQSILDEGNVKKTKEVYRLLGEHLAKEVHCIQWNQEVSNLPIIKKYSNENYKLDFIPKSLLGEVERLLTADHSEEHFVLIHGDYGPHNSLVLYDSLYVIDWEWAGWGSPMQDIAWIVWFLKLHYPDHAELLYQTFLHRYREYSNTYISAELVKTYAVSRVMTVMHRLTNASSDVKNEWIRRLHWTLETQFMI